MHTPTPHMYVILSFFINTCNKIYEYFHFPNSPIQSECERIRFPKLKHCLPAIATCSNGRGGFGSRFRSIDSGTCSRALAAPLLLRAPALRTPPVGVREARRPLGCATERVLRGSLVDARTPVPLPRRRHRAGARVALLGERVARRTRAHRQARTRHVPTRARARATRAHSQLARPDHWKGATFSLAVCLIHSFVCFTMYSRCICFKSF